MAAFIPGESPPEVKTPIFLIDLVIFKIKGVKLRNFDYKKQRKYPVF
jgi:hypothetical protein